MKEFNIFWFRWGSAERGCCAADLGNIRKKANSGKRMQLSKRTREKVRNFGKLKREMRKKSGDRSEVQVVQVHAKACLQVGASVPLALVHSLPSVVSVVSVDEVIIAFNSSTAFSPASAEGHFALHGFPAGLEVAPLLLHVDSAVPQLAFLLQNWRLRCSSSSCCCAAALVHAQRKCCRLAALPVQPVCALPRVLVQLCYAPRAHACGVCCCCCCHCARPPVRQPPPLPV